MNRESFLNLDVGYRFIDDCFWHQTETTSRSAHDLNHMCADHSNLKNNITIYTRIYIYIHECWYMLIAVGELRNYGSFLGFFLLLVANPPLTWTYFCPPLLSREIVQDHVPRETIGFPHLFVCLPVNIKLHRQETPKSVGGRKSM